MKKKLILLSILSSFILFSCNKLSERKERFSGDVVTQRGSPVPNATLSFGYAAGGKNAIQYYTRAVSDDNGHYIVDTKIYRKATIEDASVISDSGRFSSSATVSYHELSRIVVK